MGAYERWKDMVVAELTFSPNLIRERDWKRMYVRNLSIDEATAEAQVLYENSRPTKDYLHRVVKRT